MKNEESLGFTDEADERLNFEILNSKMENPKNLK